MKDRLGERKLNNQGMYMTIIAYRRSDDIDIQFEDGTIVLNKAYASFKKGSISNQNLAFSQVRKDRIGEKSITTCRHVVTIVEYRTYTDIDIQFEDGTIAKHRSYTDFKKGYIVKPGENRAKFNRAVQNRLGETITCNNGMKATIIDYISNKHIIVQFEDGTRKKCRYGDFKTGQISYPSDNSILGETVICKNGLKAVIINEINHDNIDIQFEDGIIVKHIKYSSFKKGSIQHPNINSHKYHIKDRIGETNINKDGLKMTIIEYRRSNDIDVQFETGDIVTHKQYFMFKRGNIILAKNKRIGEKVKNKQGRTLTIIGYKKADNIDVKFEDGVVLRGRQYTEFKAGAIKHPKDKIYKQNMIGNTNMTNNGIQATIIGYNNSQDMTVRLEDGTILDKAYLKEFRNGTIRHPKYIKCRKVCKFNNKDWYLCRCKKCKQYHMLALDEMKNFECMSTL